MIVTRYFEVKQSLQQTPRQWLITGVAGFIGSNLLEALLKLGQTVVGLDNFSAGHQANLELVRARVTTDQWQRFSLIEGDICDLATCQRAVTDVQHVLHEAALGSVPRSLENPIRTNESNLSGFLNMLVAARDANVSSFVYAASSSTYGDHPGLPKVEDRIGKPLSPYAVTKYVNELYADVFARCYGFNTIGLRYFNVFGPRQDPKGAYAAVIPKWFDSVLRGETIYINGDGETSRDFCFVDNVVQINLLASVATNAEAVNQIYNVALGDRTTLNELFFKIRDLVSRQYPGVSEMMPVYRDFRAGDVRHSQADITKARERLGYAPEFRVAHGLEIACDWYMSRVEQTTI